MANSEKSGSLNEKELKMAKRKRKISGIIFIFAILMFFGFIFEGLENLGFGINSGSSSSKNTAPATKDLSGKVNFSNGQFNITNQGTEDWKSCWFSVNGKYNYPTNAPYVRLDIVKAGKTISIGAEEFTLKDGTRYNPFALRANNFSASCEPNGFGYWTW